MRPRVPWGRLGAEGAVIVVSILMALAVQAWWEGRQERRQETQYLTALQRELEQGMARLPQVETAFAEMLHFHEALLAQFGDASPARADSLMFWLSALSWPPSFNPPTAVLDDLVSSQGTQLIESDGIRLGVGQYRALLARFDDAADQAWAAWADRIQPYLEGRVPRVDRLREGRYPRAVPFAPSPFEPAYGDILHDAAFESMIAERWTRLDAAQSVLGQIRSDMTSLLALIGSELGSR